jgi:peptidoglycan hydrolase CwlO-like protein
MKKLFVLLFVTLLLVSCGSEGIKWAIDNKLWDVKNVVNQIDNVKTEVDNVKTQVNDVKEKVDKIKTQVNDAKAKVDNVKTKVNETKWIIEDTSDIIGGYSDTLKWSVEDARTVKEAYDLNNQKLQDDLQKIY